MTKPKLFDQDAFPRGRFPAGYFRPMPKDRDPRSNVFDGEHPEISRAPNSSSPPPEEVTKQDVDVDEPEGDYEGGRGLSKTAVALVILAAGGLLLQSQERGKSDSGVGVRTDIPSRPLQPSGERHGSIVGSHIDSNGTTHVHLRSSG